MLRATVLGLKRSCSIIFRTCSRVSILTFGSLLITRETVERETPAFRATSSRLVRLPFLTIDLDRWERSHIFYHSECFNTVKLCYTKRSQTKSPFGGMNVTSYAEMTSLG